MRSGDSFMVGEWFVQPDLDLISRGDQQETLRPQVMELLVYLAKLDGQVAHSEELFKELWPNKVVTDATLYNCVGELRHHLDDDVEGAGSIQTIPKKGYRLLLPVNGVDNQSQSSIRTPATIFVFVLAIAAGYFAVQLAPETGLSVDPQTRPSIAVLPFVALTSNPEDEFFADGLTEELIESLSRIENLRVMGRTSSFFYKGKNQNLGVIGSELGVDNILEGSIRRVDDELRITARLLTADKGFRLWSENYDHSVDDILSIQQDIANQVTSALSTSVFDYEPDSKTTHGTSNPQAQTKYMIASAHIRRGETMWLDATQKNEHLKIARRLLDEAVSLDPEFAEAWARLVPAYYLLAGFGYSDGSGEMITRREAVSLAGIAAARALELAPESINTWVAVGHHKHQHAIIDADPEKLREAEVAFEKALSIDPGNGSALEAYASFRYRWGQYSEAKELFDRAVSLDPISTIRLRRAQSMYRAGFVDDARSEYFEVARLYPGAPYEGGIAEMEFDQGHFHHGLLWLRDLRGSLPPPYAWASLGDMERSLKSLMPYKEAGGLIAQLYDFGIQYFRREYQLLIDNAAAYKTIPDAERLFLLPSLYYLRRWEEAIEMEERIAAHEENFAGSAPTGDRLYTPVGLGQTMTRAVYYGHALAIVGRDEEAESARRRALNLVNRLPEHTPRRAQERHHLQMLIFASRGDKDAALNEFEAMVSAGWRWLMCPGHLDTFVYSVEFGWFEDSPLLDSIRDEPRFIAALQKVKADNAAMLAALNDGLTLEDIRYELVDDVRRVEPAAVTSGIFE